MIRDNIVGERNCTVSSFLGRGEEWKEEEIEAVGKYVFKNSRYQAWNGDNIPSGSSRKGTQTREKEFGWNSTVRLVVDSLVSRGNWPELFNGAPSLKFSLHRLLMDVMCSSCSCYLFKVNTPRRKWMDKNTIRYTRRNKQSNNHFNYFTNEYKFILSRIFQEIFKQI